MDHLTHFLGDRPDGRALYRYRISDGTYDALRASLRSTLLPGVQHADRETCALYGYRLPGHVLMQLHRPISRAGSHG